MSAAASDHQLLFGILALRNDLITRESLVAACAAWVGDKSRTFAEILVEQRSLTAEDGRLLAALVDRFVQQHGGRAELALSSVSSMEHIVRDLHASIADEEFRSSLQRVGSRDGQTIVWRRDTSPTGAAGRPATSQGRFRVIRPHARGGLGQVSVALDLELNREIALKEIQERFADNADSRERFMQEAEITGALEHPGIVPVYALGSDENGRPFYAMKFIKGSSLHDAIVAFHAVKPPVERTKFVKLGEASPLAVTAPLDASHPSEDLGFAIETDQQGSRAVNYVGSEFRDLLQRFVDVCNAMSYAHSRGVLHRDLKPGNIMLGKYGETLVVDWGLAKPGRQIASVESPTEPRIQPASGGSSETMPGSAVGTPAYMSPEQAAGRLEELGPTSDVYSLGATLYSLITSRAPFQGLARDVLPRVQLGLFEPVLTLAPTAPRALAAVCAKAMSLKPEDRYRDAQELAKEIERWLADEPVAAMRESFADRVGRFQRRHRTAVQVALAASVLLATVAIVSTGVISRQSSANRELAESESNLKTRALELANAKGRLATDLQVEMAQSSLTHGLREHAAGRWIPAARDLQRAASVVPDDSPLRKSYTKLAWDYATAGGRSPWPPMRHSAAIRFAGFSPDGSRIVTCSDDGLASLWDGETGAPIGPPLKHGATVVSAAFSPDGKLLATGSEDQTARLWDVSSGQPIGMPMQHAAAVPAVSFSPDGNVLGTGTHLAAHLWAVRTQRPIGPPAQHLTWVSEVVFSPNGVLAATTSFDAKTYFLDTTTGAVVGEPLPHPFGTTSTRFSQDGSRILTACLDGQARVWDVATRTEVFSTGDHGDKTELAEYSADAARIITSNRDGTIHVWESATGKRIGEPIQTGQQVRVAAFSPDSMFVASGSREGHVSVCNLSTGEKVGLSLSHLGAITALVFSSDGTRILSASEDGVARLWHTLPQQPSVEIRGHAEALWTACFSPDASRVVTASNDKTSRIWDARTGQPVIGPIEHGDRVSDAQFFPDGTRVFTVSSDGRVKVVNVSDGENAIPPLLHLGFVYSAVVTRDGKRILTADQDGLVRVWDALTGEQLQNHPVQIGHVEMIAVSPDGTRIAVNGAASAAVVGETSIARSARIFDAVSLNQMGQPLEHSGIVTKILFSPDSKLIATSCADGSARVWNVETGEPVTPLLRHASRVSDVAFSADSRRVVTAGFDNMARIWNVSTGAPIGEPMRHASIIRAAGFSPEGRTVVSSGDDGLVRLWDALTGAPTGEPMSHASKVFTVAYSPDGRRILSSSWDSTACIWNLEEGWTPEDADSIALSLWTGSDFTNTGVVHELSSTLLSERWTRIRQQRPELIQRMIESARRRQFTIHAALATAAERRADWFAARFHLQRQLLDPQLIDRPRVQKHLDRAERRLAEPPNTDPEPEAQ